MLLAATLTPVGCASNSYAHLLTAQTAQTNVVTQTAVVFKTNVVEQVSLVTVTNGVTLTNEVTEVVPVTVTNIVLATNFQVTVTNGYQVSSTVSNVLAAANLANGVTAPIDPWSVPIKLGLTGLAAAFGWFATLKSKQAAQHLSTAQTMITAVENLAPAVGDGVKAAIAQQALKMGTSATVAATVTAVTNDLAKTS